MFDEMSRNIQKAQSALKRLSGTQQKVVDMRLAELAANPTSASHGFDTRSAKVLGVTREAVRQQRTKAQGRLLKFFISWELKK